MQQTLNTASLVEVVRQASAISEQDYKDIIAEIQQTGASEAAVLSKHGVPSDILALATRVSNTEHLLHNWKVYFLNLPSLRKYPLGSHIAIKLCLLS